MKHVSEKKKLPDFIEVVHVSDIDCKYRTKKPRKEMRIRLSYFKYGDVVTLSKGSQSITLKITYICFDGIEGLQLPEQTTLLRCTLPTLLEYKVKKH